MQPEDILLLGVAAVVALNRGFSGTGLRDSTTAYVIVQIIDLMACAALFFFRMEGFPPQLDFWVRTFLTLFVGWQMVNNNQLRVTRRRRDQIEVRRARERERLLAEIHAQADPNGIPGESD